MDIRTAKGFGKLNARERVVASAVLSIVHEFNRLDEYMSPGMRSDIMDDIEADVIRLAKLFY